MNIPEVWRQAYLQHSLNLSDAERKKVAEYAEWLPAIVVDAHAHSNLPEHVDDVPDKAYSHMMSTFPSFSIAESQRVNDVLHPFTEMHRVRFAHVFRGIAHRAANDYLLDNCPTGDRAALYGLPDDVPYTVEMLQDPRVAGLKMYYSYVEPTATRIYDVFKPEILAAAEQNGVPIILHTPKVITDSADDVVAMTEDFPDLKVSIAHLGSSKFDIPQLQDVYDMLAEGTNVAMDTALNPSPEVVRRALHTFGPDRIMYGSDEPLNLLRSVPYVHPEYGERITTTHRYHWQDIVENAEYSRLAIGAVHSHWLCLDALQSAIKGYSAEKQEDIKLKVFRDNAATLFGFTLDA